MTGVIPGWGYCGRTRADEQDDTEPVDPEFEAWLDAVVTDEPVEQVAS